MLIIINWLIKLIIIDIKKSKIKNKVTILILLITIINPIINKYKYLDSLN